MTPYLQLDLTTLPIDMQLARRVPYALSCYYLALPLSRENDRVSVAMAYPENQRARQTLTHLLQAEVVPVFVPVETLQSALDRIHQPALDQRRRTLAWLGAPEWQTAVLAAAALLDETFLNTSTLMTPAEGTLSQALALAAAGHYEAVLFPLPAGTSLASLEEAQPSLFLVRGQPRPLRRILLVLRGFASDERALDWLAPLARRHQAAVTLLPLLHGVLNQYHDLASPAARHLDRCLHRLAAQGVPVDLKYRRGSAVGQVADEVTGNPYDLLLLAAEAKGDFVARVITAVDQRQAHDQRPIFVLKPPDLPGQHPSPQLSGE